VLILQTKLVSFHTVRALVWVPLAALAQLVERLTRNEKVAGSIPAGGPTGVGEEQTGL